MRAGETAGGTKRKPASPSHYDAVSELVCHKAFVRWREDPDEPRRWADVLDFLGLKPGDDSEAPARLRHVSNVIRTAMDWCNSRDVVYLTKDPPRTHAPIHVRDMSEMNDFLRALTYRFPRLEESKKQKLPKKG